LAQHTLDEPVFLQPVQAICDLMFVRPEQWPTPLQSDVDLDRREASTPAEYDAANRAGHAALSEDKIGDGREP